MGATPAGLDPPNSKHKVQACSDGGIWWSECKKKIRILYGHCHQVLHLTLGYVWIDPRSFFEVRLMKVLLSFLWPELIYANKTVEEQSTSSRMLRNFSQGCLKLNGLFCVIATDALLYQESGWIHLSSPDRPAALLRCADYDSIFFLLQALKNLCWHYLLIIYNPRQTDLTKFT